MSANTKPGLSTAAPLEVDSAGGAQQIEGLGVSHKLQQDSAASASLNNDCCQEAQHSPAAIGELHLPGVPAAAAATP